MSVRIFISININGKSKFSSQQVIAKVELCCPKRQRGKQFIKPSHKTIKAKLKITLLIIRICIRIEQYIQYKQR